MRRMACNTASKTALPCTDKSPTPVKTQAQKHIDNRHEGALTYPLYKCVRDNNKATPCVIRSTVTKKQLYCEDRSIGCSLKLV
jgi:hypothetical protein